MDPILDAFLRSWPCDPWFVIPLLLTGIIYLRGWRRLHRRGSQHFQPFQLITFLGGLTALFLALASPIEPFAFYSLQIHMTQHLLLTMVAPPLLWLGAPFLPILRGLPRSLRMSVIVPWLHLEALRTLGRRLTHPVLAWVLFVAASWLWHIPACYEAALASERWHYVEHACFLGTGLLFWWPVIQPYPSTPQVSRWLIVPYLILADLANTALAALLTLAERILYPHYARVPNPWGIAALDDQAGAGLLMWIPGSLAYLVPLVWIGARLLFPGKASGVASAPRGRADDEHGVLTQPRSPGRIALPMVTVAQRSPDVLTWPLIGRFLKWRHARLALQLPLFALALLLIGDGLVGPDVAPMNLAGVLPWVHWRGLLVLGLLAGGNFFCMACPFTLPRTVARRFFRPRWGWPRWLRSKWLAVGLLGLFFWAYEALALWASPWWTAWIAIGYFLSVFVIDSLFRGAAFCKYVCPIGQFNFVQSLVSPLELAVRDPAVCQRCVTKDCLRGRGTLSGCELGLFLPRKHGNLDCTFCLDCIHACPHDNLGIVGVVPGQELFADRQRSGVGRLARRPDVAALALLLTFAAFANAASMVSPVLNVQDQLARTLGWQQTTWIITAGLFSAIVLLPLLTVGTATALSRWGSGADGRWLETACRYSLTLVPLGFGMWLSHYSFHFFTGMDGIVPVVQRCAADLGLTGLGAPAWTSACCLTVASWLLRLEILFLDGGLLLSLYAAYRQSMSGQDGFARAVRVFAPWAVLMVLLFTLGIWILFQPMEMRGLAEGAR